MCGLVCIMSKQASTGFLYKDKTIFLQMLISDMFRGMDSTGTFAVNKHGNLKMVKDASPAPFFINKKESNTYFNDFISDYHIVVGHNRKATMGATVSENAHPFIEGNICLVHNGTLQNHYKLANRQVDSNAIAAHIEEHGYKSLLKNIEGAYALIWYNAAEKTLYFTRNADRPLYLVETSERIFLASESKMLDWILDRNDITKYTIQNVPTDKVFKFSLETRKLEAESKPKKADPVKNKPNQNQRHQHRVNQMHSGFGHLALAYSSEVTQNTETAPGKKKANIETYKSDERISWKVNNWEYRTGSTKLTGVTTDDYKTPVTVFMDSNLHTAQDIDDLTSAEYLTGQIITISYKKGVTQLYLKNVAIDDVYTTLNHKKVSLGMIEEAGSCCYSCGQILKTRKEIEESIVSINSRNEILFITCGECSSATAYHGGCC